MDNLEDRFIKETGQDVFISNSYNEDYYSANYVEWLENLNDNDTDNVFIQEVYKALGWQGGTIHQVVKEIERLKSCESSYKAISR